jgi:hypothetical protein
LLDFCMAARAPVAVVASAVDAALLQRVAPNDVGRRWSGSAQRPGTERERAIMGQRRARGSPWHNPRWRKRPSQPQASE